MARPSPGTGAERLPEGGAHSQQRLGWLTPAQLCGAVILNSLLPNKG